MKQNRKKKEYIYFDYGTNSHNYEYQYDSMGRLVEEKKIIRRVNNLAWKKTFEYQKDRLIILREFFITYWDKIPPIERETQFFDENNKITKIERSNMKDIENGTILKKYDEKGDSVIEEYYDVFGKFVRKHIIIFQ